MNDRTRGTLFVVAQFVSLGVLVVTPRGSLWSTDGFVNVAAWVLIVLGLALVLVAATGLGASLTAHPVPKSESTLRTTGLYGLVRHPIYLGVLVFAAGLVISGASIVHLLAFSALAVILHVKARFEERLLAAKFPEYADYARRIGRLVPRLSAPKAP